MMATYQFRAKDGEVIERVFSMHNAPKVGAVIRCHGKRFSRIPSWGAAHPKDERHVCYTLPRLWQEPSLAKVWSKFDERGHMVCEGKRDRIELQARMNARDGHVTGYTWDDC
jgi:hypothetical protein